MDAHNLRGPRRIERLDFAVGLEPVAADDQVVLAAELAGDMVQRRLHRACVLRVLEVDKRLIYKAALGKARLNLRGKGCGRHNNSSVVRNRAGWYEHATGTPYPASETLEFPLAGLYFFPLSLKFSAM